MEPVVKKNYGRETEWQSREISLFVARGRVCVHRCVGRDSWVALGSLSAWRLELSKDLRPVRKGAHHCPSVASDARIPLKTGLRIPAALTPPGTPCLNQVTGNGCVWDTISREKYLFSCSYTEPSTSSLMKTSCLFAHLKKKKNL